MIFTLTLNPAVDKSSSIDQVVAERKLRCEPPVFEPGGGGINVSRAIRNLGGDSVMIFCAGGTSGERLQRLIVDEGLTHRVVAVSAETRENLSVLEKSTNRQFRFGMPGPRLEEADWQNVLDMITALKPVPDYFVASGSLADGVPRDFYARVARILRPRGCRVVVDTSGKALREAGHAGVFLLKPNLRELQELAGQEAGGDVEPATLARNLVRKGASEVVVLTLGAAGALLVTKDLTRHILAPTVPIRSKVGAGDSTVAGIVLALDRGWSLEQAAAFGVAAGAAAVMTRGTELCRKEDTERLYRSMGILA